MSISGLISVASGSSLPATGITVRAYSKDDLWTEVAAATVTSNGKYTLSGLKAGGYVLFVDVAPSTGLLAEWYNDKTSRYAADAITLAAGVDRTGVNVTLAKAASISGVVTVPAGTPGGVSGVFVSAYDQSQSWIGSAAVAADGSYTVSSLPAGPVFLQFSSSSSSGLVTEWFNDKKDFSTADAITLTAGEKRTGADVTLAKGAVISGRVSVPTGVTISSWTIRVSVYHANQRWVADTYAASDGTYRLAGLPAGDYRLQIDADTSSGLRDEWYEDAANFGSAKTVTVAAGATRTGVNPTLARGATISGRVTVPAGSSPSEVSIYVYDSSQSTVGYTNVRSDGTYSVGGLPGGSLRVRFSAYSPSVLLPEWWKDAADFASATPIDVSAGGTRTGIDATLGAGASISGTVTAPAGYAVSGGSVQVYSSEHNWVSSTPVSADGSYAVTGLREGTYHLRFQPPYGSALLSEWWDDATTWSASTGITLASAQAVTGVDAQFAVGATITGTVTVPVGTPRGSNGSRISVYASSNSGGSYSSSSTTVNADGTYALRGLLPGEYVISFQAPDEWGLIDEYYNDVATYADATRVAVGAGQTVSGVDASLITGSTISGRVTLPAGVSVDSMQYRVTAYGPQMSYVASTGIQVDGTYSLRGLPAGSYRLQFSAPSSSGVLSEWYSDKANYWSADSLTVTAAQSVSHVDVTLDRGGVVKGYVRDAAGAPVSNARVTIHPRSGSTWGWGSSVTTDSAGAYTFTGLSPATYALEFTPPSGSALLPEWWNDSTDQATATGLTVDAGQVRSNLVTKLATGGSVAGTVRSADGVAVGGADVRVMNRAGVEVGSSRTDAAGAFRVVGLRAGDVAVGVLTGGGLTFSNGAGSIVAAAFSSVALGRTTTVEIALGGRSITGVITAADTGAAISSGTVTLYSSTGAAGIQATIGKGGAYALRNVPPGSYTLAVRPADAAYAQTWAFGASSAAESDYFTMSTTSLKKNLAVLRAGAITGDVRTSSQGGLSLGLWQSNGATWERTGSQWISDGQTFTFGSLAPGVYALVSSTYDFASDDPASAPRITVGAGATVDIGTVTDVPASAGSLSGSVSGITSASNVAVFVTSADGTIRSTTVKRTGPTSFTYTFPALSAGSYTVGVQSPSAPTAWYGGTSASSARKVTVSAGGAASANLAVVPGKASLVGTVTGPDGVGVAGVYVAVTETTAAGGIVDARSVTTGADGRYSFPSALAAGHAYTVTASNSPGTSARAEILARTGSQTVDLAFAAPARLKGTVLDATTGAPVVGTPVHIVLNNDEGLVEETVTDSRGRYDFSDLSSGSYRVRVGAYSSGYSLPDARNSTYAPEWVDNAATRSAATPVAVTAGSVATVPTSKLSAGGLLTGRVKASLATGGNVWLSNAHVSVKTTSGEEVVSAETSATGAPGVYSAVLPPGTYRVCASLPTGVPRSDHFGEACGTTTVTVKAGAASTANVTLTELKDLQTTKPRIIGSPKVGSTLTADPGAWTAGTTLGYTWFAGSQAIAGATKSTFRLTSAQVGKAITVRVRGTQTGYVPASLTSSATSPVK